jgi:hypothetical protein
MAVLTTTLGAEFTPAVGEFNVQVVGSGDAYLWRKNNSGATFVEVRGNPVAGAVLVDNPVAGAVYKLLSDDSVTISVDQ